MAIKNLIKENTYSTINNISYDKNILNFNFITYENSSLNNIISVTNYNVEKIYFCETVKFFIDTNETLIKYLDDLSSLDIDIRKKLYNEQTQGYYCKLVLHTTEIVNLYKIKLNEDYDVQYEIIDFEDYIYCNQIGYYYKKENNIMTIDKNLGLGTDHFYNKFVTEKINYYPIIKICYDVLYALNPEYYKYPME